MYPNRHTVASFWTSCAPAIPDAAHLHPSINGSPGLREQHHRTECGFGCFRSIKALSPEPSTRRTRIPSGQTGASDTMTNVDAEPSDTIGRDTRGGNLLVYGRDRRPSRYDQGNRSRVDCGDGHGCPEDRAALEMPGWRSRRLGPPRQRRDIRVRATVVSRPVSAVVAMIRNVAEGVAW